MNSIVLGAGRVGESVAESRVSEKNDIAAIDTNAARWRQLQVRQDRLDLRGVAGNGIEPSVLEAAGTRDADMLIACASADATNLVACKVACRLAGMDRPVAFMHLCTTMGLGGFSSHDLSFGYWNSPSAEAVAVVFKLLSGNNFALYFVAWRQRPLKALWRDPEVRAFYALGLFTPQFWPQ